MVEVRNLMKSFTVLMLFLALSCARSPRPDSDSAIPSGGEARPSESPIPASTPTAPPGSVLRPVDETAQDHSFAEFRQKMEGILERRDEPGLIGVLAADIQNGFGGADVGVKGFRAKWSLDEPDSRVWTELRELMDLGGSFQSFPGHPHRFCAPYVYSSWPAEVDSYNHMAAIGENVPLRASPTAEGEVVARTAYGIVEVLRSDPPENVEGWWHVRTAEGSEGWVSSGDVRSPLDYRACFEKIGGDWKMTLLVAGD